MLIVGARCPEKLTQIFERLIDLALEKPLRPDSASPSAESKNQQKALVNT